MQYSFLLVQHALHHIIHAFYYLSTSKVSILARPLGKESIILTYAISLYVVHLWNVCRHGNAYNRSLSKRKKDLFIKHSSVARFQQEAILTATRTMLLSAWCVWRGMSNKVRTLITSALKIQGPHWVIFHVSDCHKGCSEISGKDESSLFRKSYWALWFMEHICFEGTILSVKSTCHLNKKVSPTSPPTWSQFLHWIV